MSDLVEQTFEEVSVTSTQQKIITYPVENDKTLQIVSGPGAGKTTTLCYRIAYLLEHLNYKPEEILILSMTNKAVDNMKQSLLNLLKNQELVDNLGIYTFNSFCHNFLNECDKDFLSSDIIEDAGWRTIIQLLESKKRITKFKLQKLLRELSKLNETQLDDYLQLLSKLHNISEDDIIKIMKILKSMKILTHSDILNRAKKLLSEDNDIELTHKITIVDEFQDMYQDLYDVIKLVSKGTHLTIAGDLNQSIYGFLGSDPVKINNQLNELNLIEKIEMFESFRSSPEIIKCSNSLIYDEEECLKRNNLDNFAIKFGPKPIYNVFENNIQQFEFISTEINRLISESEGLIQLKDIAILTRTNKQIDKLSSHFESIGIQSHKLSSTPSWLSNDLFHFVDYLKIVFNPFNANFPILCTLDLLPKIGPKTIRKLYSLSMEENKPIYDYLSTFNNKSFLNYYNRLESYRGLDFNDPNAIFQCATDLGQSLGLTARISKNSISKELILKQLYDFKENLNLMNQLRPENMTLLEFFLENYSNLLPTSLTENSVSLSTIHSAKGLEFPIVFLPEFKPHGLRPMWDPYSSFYLTEEDKRLEYVGMTRAKNLLYMQMNSIDIDPREERVFDKSLISNSPPELNTNLLNLIKQKKKNFNGHNLPYSLAKSFYRTFHTFNKFK